MPVNPGTLFIVGLIGGIGSAVTYATFQYVKKAEQGASQADLMPMSMNQGPPLPKSLNIRWPWKK